MGLFDQTLIKNAYFRGIFIFLIGFSVEVLQYSGFIILGNTVDIYYLVADAGGILLAAIYESFVLNKFTKKRHK